MNYESFLFLFALIITSCNSSKYLVSNTGFPKAPDYNYMKNWIASPKEEIPLPVNYYDTLKDFKANVDVFYLYQQFTILDITVIFECKPRGS